MTVAAQQLVEQFKQLADPDKQEVVEAIVREAAAPERAGRSRKSVAEIRAFRPLPDSDADIKPHDRDFAEAIIESKKHPTAS